ncbi:hypothetical protein [Polaribacter sp. Z022]|uniref:hypothetical protein n=1 Tax=Polaribacter sp. Z022 TaxID=2927125 RepID=UPI002020B095|nr:hypothetical protein [Polaribacter sp. Z022]MCL7752151.1 hypothetical protein [Polaribacter sp. Z022]
MKKHLTIFLFSFSMFLIASCTKAFIPDIEDTTNPITKVIKYNTDVKQIMTNNCITCHGGPSPSDGLDLTTFANVKNAALNRNLIERMNDATAPMPQSGLLLLSTRKIIDKWKADGFLEN